jgi:hypothetical protein
MDEKLKFAALAGGSPPSKTVRMNPSYKFRVTWRVNGEVTYILENVDAEMAYSEAVPDEALRPEPCNRWHVYMRAPALSKMRMLSCGEEFSVAYQNPSPVGADQEEIRIERIV